MKKLLLILVIIIIAFTSCEGRKTSNQALSESIEEFKKNVSLEITVFHPDTYVEQEVDSLLSNGFHIKIKAYTDMDKSVLFTKIKDTINYQTHYRNYKFDILVEKDGKAIYQKSFDKQTVNKILDYRTNYTAGSSLYNFDQLAVLKSIQVDDENTLKNKVAIMIMYAIPESNKYAIHKLFIDETGRSNIVQIEVN